MTATVPAGAVHHEAHVQSRNPYVGPRAFRTGETLYGRDGERDEFVDLLIAERIVLLHSPSGAGKTSLVQAAVVPVLRDHERFTPLPTMRVNADPGDLAGARRGNRYVQSVLLELQKPSLGKDGKPEELAPTATLSESELGEMELGKYLERREPGGSRPVLLIFDQFEEIFTIDPTDRPAKEEFFRQVGEALRARHRWAIFSMRDEFVAALEPYTSLLPTALATRFRLELLDERAAEDAIRRPAERQPFKVDFTPRAASKIIDSLRRVQAPDGATTLIGPYIEPVHLQVVCTYLWDKLQPQSLPNRRIEPDHVEDVDEIDVALSKYFDEKVEMAVRETDVREWDVRRWCGEALIDPRGFRSQVAQGAEGLYRLTQTTLDRLVDAYVIRADERRGAVWYELAHDRLVGPIRDSNQAWLEKHASPLEREAITWDRARRPAELLAHGRELKAHRGWADEHPSEVSDAARAYLQAAGAVEDSAHLKQKWHMAKVAAVLAVLLVGFVFAGQRAVEEHKEGEQQTIDSVKTWTALAYRDTVSKLQPEYLEREWGLTTLGQSVKADEAIQQLTRESDPVARSAIVVRYFQKPSDEGRVDDALGRVGFRVDQRAARAQDLSTNAISYGDGVGVENVQLVALHLVRAGVQLRRICRFQQQTGRERTVEVLGSLAASRFDPIPLAQIQAMGDARREIHCTMGAGRAI